MQYLMLTVVGQQGAADWEAMTEAERADYIALHVSWFREHDEHITGGEELAPPSAARTIRRRLGEVLVTDGPFTETKEHIGGYILLEAPELDAALAIARSWPSLATDGNTVEVRPLAGMREAARAR